MQTPKETNYEIKTNRFNIYLSLILIMKNHVLLMYSFVSNCRGGEGGGGNKMHQGGNYQDFLKLRAQFVEGLIPSISKTTPNPHFV